MDIVFSGVGGQRLLYTAPDGTISDTISGTFVLLLEEEGQHLLTYIDSCNRTATDTITLHPRPRPELELGPDITLCSNGVTALLAQPGFESYEWVDGTTDRSFTAFEAGTYWVAATDSCGELQSDTLRVFIDPATEIKLGRDTVICPGDTVTFSLTGFTDYQWSQSSYIDCVDCPTVRFAPDRDTLLLVAAQQGPSCFSSDSIRVRIADLTGRNTPTALCVGDTLFIDNQIVTSGEQYLYTVPVATCFRTDTIQVTMLSDTTFRDTLSICPGDSILVFGIFEMEENTYIQVLTRDNGCDSISEVHLSLYPNPNGLSTIRLCRGDSALVFDQFETESGTFSRAFTSSGGCDSLHTIMLEVNGAILETDVSAVDCGAADAGAGEVQITGGWSVQYCLEQRRRHSANKRVRSRDLHRYRHQHRRCLHPLW